MWTTLRVDHMSTGQKQQQEEQNKTRNVLPMSSVRSVTHVPGCTEVAERVNETYAGGKGHVVPVVETTTVEVEE
jgi:hypothetical protein